MPRGTAPRSRDAVVAVGTVVAPAVDGGARGPRDARRHDLARRPGRSPEATSARTSSRTEPTAACPQVQRCQHLRGCWQAQVPARETLSLHVSIPPWPFQTWAIGAETANSGIVS